MAFKRDDTQSDDWLKPTGAGNSVLRAAAWVFPRVAKYTHGSMVLVTNPHGHCLMVTHRWRERGRFGFPGGTHVPHEDAREAAARELREETGLMLDADHLEPVSAYVQPWSLHFEHLYRGRVGYTETQKATRGGEIKSAVWCDLASLKHDDLTRATQYALTHLPDLPKARRAD